MNLPVFMLSSAQDAIEKYDYDRPGFESQLLFSRKQYDSHVKIALITTNVLATTVLFSQFFDTMK